MLNQFTQLLTKVTSSLGFTYPDEVITTEPPEHIPGDFSTNIAMQLGRTTGGNPRAIAERFVEKLQADSGIVSAEIAGPGFINVVLSDKWYANRIKDDLAQIPASDPVLRVMVEYLSANPTGPVHIGNARGGPIGETISRVLEARGPIVERHFYVNDIGGQAISFAKSVLHYYKEALGLPTEFPEKGYPAMYVQELGKTIAKELGDTIAKLPEGEQVDAMRKESIKRQLEVIKKTAERMNIKFDQWFFQSSLTESGKSQAVLEKLKKHNAVLEKEGALWLRSGFQEDDRETVLVKSDGSTTYFLDDIAYHYEKLVVRGFDEADVVLGSNHSGHIPRMRAAMQALGIDPALYEGVQYQYVQLKEDGKTKRMAKREGTFVTADEVLDEVPLEVFNYFMLSKANETHLDFDLKLAKDTSEKNPIYYIQYAHARICSLLANAEEQHIKEEKLPDTFSFSEEEKALIRHLTRFTEVIHEVVNTYRTHVIPAYLHELATRYHHFYAHQRIITDDPLTTSVRLQLSRLSASVLAKGLSLLNIQALEKM